MEAKEQEGGAIDFWGLIGKLFLALLIIVVIAGLLLGFLWVFGYLIGVNIIYKFLAFICRNKWLYIILNVVPIILEVIGLILSIFAVGIPIVGFGMFLEVLVIICDFIRKDPGWQWDVAIGIFGLLPIIGLLGNIGKVGKILIKSL